MKSEEKLRKKLGREPTAEELKAFKAKRKAKKEATEEEDPSSNKPPKKKKKKKEDVVSEVFVEDPDEDGGLTPCLSWSDAEEYIGKTLSKYCVDEKKWNVPTPIQQYSWPMLSRKRDVVAVAETGSGKTLAFGATTLLQLSKKKSGLAALVLCPTRELARQSFDVLAEFGKVLKVQCAVAYGGVSKRDQGGAIRSCSLLVATPGRLHDLANNDDSFLADVSFFCLDEADRMLDMGFVQVVRDIASKTKSIRTTCMFSATWPTEVRGAASEFLLKNYILLGVGGTQLSRNQSQNEEPVANVRVEQIVKVVDERLRDGELTQILKTKFPTDAIFKSHKVIVFALYKKECARLERLLNDKHFPCVAIHGDMTQANRSKSFDDFKNGRVPCLVATDVAARGLDIPDVHLVLNYSFPLTIEDYVHRIGRTGRAGKTGTAITFFHGNGHEKALAGALQNVLRKANNTIPPALLAFGSTVKKKQHKLYGAFGPDDSQPMKQATRITFD